jgi:hypothetical protein
VEFTIPSSVDPAWLEKILEEKFAMIIKDSDPEESLSNMEKRIYNRTFVNLVNQISCRAIQDYDHPDTNDEVHLLSSSGFQEIVETQLRKEKALSPRALLKWIADERDGITIEKIFDDEEWIDPRLDLVRQLIEYKKFKDAAGQLLELETLQSEAFAYGGEKPVFEEGPEDAGQALGDIGLFDLLSAFQEVLARAPMEPLGHLEPIRWSVPDKMESIISLTKARGQVVFSKLFNTESHRGEVIVTFLALLELLRLRQISLHQNAAFHEILILPAEDLSAAGLPAPVIGGGEHVES